MRVIKLQDAQIGLVLAKEIVDKNGRVIVKKGTKLTEKHLKAFKVWRVMQFYVEGEGEEVASEGVSEEDFLKAERKVRPNFRHTDMESDFIKTLYDYCVRKEVNSTK